MKKSVKIVSITLCLLFAIAQLSGCGKKPTSKEQVKTINIWSMDSHSKTVMTSLINEFNESIGKEKGINIVYSVKEGNYGQNLEVALASNQAADMFTTWNIQKYSENGSIIALEDLPGTAELIKNCKDYLIKFTNTYKDKTYSLPFKATTQGFIYNKDMFKKAGLVDEKGEAKPPETYAEVREYAKKLTNPASKEYGIIIPMKWGDWVRSDIEFPALASYGHTWFDPVTGKIDYSIYKPMMDTFMGIKKDGSYFPGAEGMDNDPARALFAEGKIGMKFAYSFDVAVLNDQFPAKCDWGVVPCPVVDKNKRYAQRMAVDPGYCINKKNVEAIGPDRIVEVLKWLHSDKLITELYKEGKEMPYKWDVVKDVKIENPKKGWVDFCNFTKISIPQQPEPKMDLSGQKKFFEMVVNHIWTENMTVDEALKVYTNTSIEAVDNYYKQHTDESVDTYINKEWDASLK